MVAGWHLHGEVSDVVRYSTQRSRRLFCVMRSVPMFRLGSAVLPVAGLPIHVIENRYRALMKDCMAGDREFGVVLIERGSEVGGGDVRADVGTVARIAEASELPDGRWALIAVGDRRIRVTSWLPDDPYPRAEVEIGRAHV